MKSRILITTIVIGFAMMVASCAASVPATPEAAPTAAPVEAAATPTPTEAAQPTAATEEAVAPTPAATEEAAEQESASAESAEASTEEPLTIGAVFHATGWMASFDQLPRQGVVLAIEEINKAGGILGREVQLIELDGKTDPATVANASIQVIEQGAEVMIAPCDFDQGAPVSIEAQKVGLVGISTCASSPLYGSVALGDKQFTTSMWNNTMGAAGAEFGYKDKGWRTAYVVADVSEYGRTLADSFRDHFETLGGEILGEDTYTYGDQDFSAQINRIQALDNPPDVLYISSFMPDIGTIVRQVRGADIEAAIMGGDGYETPEFYEAIGAEAGNEIYIVTHSWLGPEAGPAMAEFVKLYEAKFGEPPEVSYIVMGWDTVQILAQAIEHAGTTEGEALAKAMEELEYELLSGSLKWTPAAEGHFPQKSAAVLEVQEGQPAFVKWVLPESVPQPQ